MLSDPPTAKTAACQLENYFPDPYPTDNAIFYHNHTWTRALVFTHVANVGMPRDIAIDTDLDFHASAFISFVMPAPLVLSPRALVFEASNMFGKSRKDIDEPLMYTDVCRS